jgi:hypothetical protein
MQQGSMCRRTGGAPGSKTKTKIKTKAGKGDRRIKEDPADAPRAKKVRRRGMPPRGVKGMHRIVNGDRVLAQYGTDVDEAWFTGTAVGVNNAAGTCDVHYADGDKEVGKSLARVRADTSGR